jgi:hypothetical protein
MYDSDVTSQVPKDLEMMSPRIEDKKKTMKVRDLEKYFGALKESKLLDEMREQILRMRDIQD